MGAVMRLRDGLERDWGDWFEVGLRALAAIEKSEECG
jgi:hypothetical protein